MRMNSFSIVTDDVAGAARFFRDVLGLTVAEDGDFAEVDAGGRSFTIMRGAMVPMTAPAGVILQFDVDDVQAAFDGAKDRGAVVLAEPAKTDWGTESAYLRGPDELVVELLRATS